MVLVKDEAAIYYKETSSPSRSAKFCLKPVNSVSGSSQKSASAEKRPEAVNVQVVKGKTTTFIHLDEDEAKKVQAHGDMVIKKLQRIHKSVIWNLMVSNWFPMSMTLMAITGINPAFPGWTSVRRQDPKGKAGQ